MEEPSLAVWGFVNGQRREATVPTEIIRTLIYIFTYPVLGASTLILATPQFRESLLQAVVDGASAGSNSMQCKAPSLGQKSPKGFPSAEHDLHAARIRRCIRGAITRWGR